jgi:hypothetical protein
MTRTILAGLAVAVSAVAFVGTGCQSTGIGDPCTPEQEYDPTFSGFDEHEVSTESESFQCQTRLCLVNHFQGRVSCPYGQGWDKKALKVTINSPATAACSTPGIGTPVTGPLDKTGAPVDPKNAGEGVKPQCTDRTADKTVYCSCRCADISGTQNGGNFCNCPDGFACTQLVSSLSAGSDQGLTGAYCIKSGTAFGASASSAIATTCDPCGSGGLKCGNASNNGGS